MSVCLFTQNESRLCHMHVLLNMSCFHRSPLIFPLPCCVTAGAMQYIMCSCLATGTKRIRLNDPSHVDGLACRSKEGSGMVGGLDYSNALLNKRAETR